MPHSCQVCGFISKDNLICKKCLPDGWTERARCFHCYYDLDFSGVCQVCSAGLPPFWRMRYLWQYQLLARDLIISCKNLPSRALCEFAAQTLAASIPNLFNDTDWDLIVPIPPTPKALHKRGFVITDILAQAICSKIKTNNKSVALSFCLTHQGNKLGPQSTLKTEQRVRNVQNSFLSKPLNGDSVLLVDDVLTTGATTLHAVLALLKAGASRVDVVVLARAARWHPQAISGILSGYGKF